MVVEDLQSETLATVLAEQTDPMVTVYLASLMGITKSLWRVSGEGSGGVTRAFGEDLWDLVKMGADMLGEDRDTSNPKKAMEFYDKYLLGRFNVAESIDYNVSDNVLEMTVKNCNVHHYTDYLEENDVPRSVGCPLALIGLAMMEEVTGEPFVVDKVESKDGISKIVLKTF
jgi:hypothetical protein